MEGPTKGGSQRETARGGASEGPEPVEKTSEEMPPRMKNGKRQQIKKKNRGCSFVNLRSTSTVYIRPKGNMHVLPAPYTHGLISDGKR